MDGLDGLSSRVAVLESQIRDIKDDVRDIRTGDLKDIKSELHAMRDELAERERGMSRPEKIALIAAGSGVVGSIVAVIVLVSSAPMP